MQSPIHRCLGSLALALGTISIANAQTDLFRFPNDQSVVVFRSTDPAPVVSWAPVIETPVEVVTPTEVLLPAQVTAPIEVPAANVITTMSPVTSPIVAPARAIVATEWTPVNNGPVAVTTFSPVVTTAWSAAVPSPTPVAVEVWRPTVTFQPVVVPATSAPMVVVPTAVVPAGPRVTVRPKVYIQGQPIRNLFRAITP